MKQILVFVLLAMVVASCQKVVNINLNSSAPQYVVEGNVTDTAGAFSVKLTTSVNYDQDNVFPTVSGAIVTIRDTNTGHMDSLSEVQPGYYQTIGGPVAGIYGHTYFLSVNIGGKLLTSYSTMPAEAISLDSLYTQVSGFRGDISIVPVYTDPVAKGNFYRFVVTKNDTLSSAIYVRNDALVNGQVIKQPLNGGGGDLSKIIPGDFMSVEMQCIDSMAYQFYYTLEQSRNQNSATPTNPVSNIMGGQCLGYFSAHTTTTKFIYIP